MENLHLQPTSCEAQSPSRLREVQETPPFSSQSDAPQMNLSTCPQTVLRASSCCMPLPVSSSLDRMLATRSQGASPVDVTAGQQSAPWSQTRIKETRRQCANFFLSSLSFLWYYPFAQRTSISRRPPPAEALEQTAATLSHIPFSTTDRTGPTRLARGRPSISAAQLLRRQAPAVF